MAFDFRKFIKGIRLIGISGSTSGTSEKGDLDVTDGNSKLNYHNGTNSSPVVTEAHTATLTNKTIDGDDNTLQDVSISSLKTVAGDANKVIRRDGSGVVVSSNSIPNTNPLVTTDSTSTLTNKTISADDNTISGIAASSFVLSNASGNLDGSAAQKAIPSGVVVGTTDSQTLTNKTIAAGSNTISGLSNTNLSGSAAISNANLATMSNNTVKGNASGSTATPSDLTLSSSNTASSVVYRDSSGNFSAGTITATLSGTATNITGIAAIANGGTGQSTQTAAFDALAPTTTAGDLIVRGSSNNVSLGVGSDGQVLVADSSQTNKLKWTTLQQGSKNYITNGGFENNSTNSWSSVGCATVTNNFPASVGSGGLAFSSSNGGRAKNAATASPSVISSGQLAGNYSLSWGFTTTGTTGDMLISPAITLDLEAQASVQTFSFFYKVASSSGSSIDFSGTSSNTLGVAIYDITNNAWIQPAGVFNLVQLSGVGKASGTFQVPSNTTQVQLAIYIANPQTSSSLTVYLDDFILGPQVVQYGAPVTDWEPFTPTGSWGGVTYRE